MLVASSFGRAWGLKRDSEALPLQNWLLKALIGAWPDPAAAACAQGPCCSGLISCFCTVMRPVVLSCLSRACRHVEVLWCKGLSSLARCCSGLPGGSWSCGLAVSAACWPCCCARRPPCAGACNSMLQEPHSSLLLLLSVAIAAGQGAMPCAVFPKAVSGLLSCSGWLRWLLWG